MSGAYAVDGPAFALGPGALGRRLNRLVGPSPGWLPGDPAAESFEAAPGGDDSDGYVCPFCGETYAGSRRRCASCDGLPVVPREDRRVYEVVIGLCGPRCAAAALEAATPLPGHR